MSKQLLFMWSTFRDSSIGTKLKYFWRTHESVQSAWIFSQKHVSQTITFRVIHILWFYNRYKVEIFLKNSWNCEVHQNLFTKSCLTNNYLESRNVDHVKGNCSWDMHLWINSGGRHSFMSFSKIFQFCTHARITKCRSRET